MSAARFICAAVAALSIASLAHAGGITIASNALGPEGPQFFDGNLCSVDWTSNTLSKWDGKLLHVFRIAAGDGTTNVALGPGEKELYLSVVKDPTDSQETGSIVKIPNVDLVSQPRH